MNLRTTRCSLALVLLLAGVANGGTRVSKWLEKPDAWFATPEAIETAAHILSYQTDAGGWPKNTDTATRVFDGDRSSLHPTFDNGATTDELRFLARCFNATSNPAYRSAFSKGLGYILTAQYPTGGWPQFYPPSKQYHRHITFNDNAMVRLLEFLREVQRTPTFAFVPEKDRQAASAAFDRGIACILRCQILVDGRPTVWCAQHDEIDYSPRPARAFEPASFSGSESVGITRLLMSLDSPSPEIIAAIEGAVAWFEKSKITGIRIETRPAPELPGGKDRVVVADASAPVLWARFYDLKTGKPVFSDRDSVLKSTLAEIGPERRNGYSWYGTYATQLLAKNYPAWKKRLRR